ncbi:hypothetical protein AB0B15_17075 [Streptomyces sp. NPDC045456]|uniref:hypothetical protein n=1 Tax=Streptomyces sp. NPDC045456 TaxID=3155254 RepID=UPI0033E57D87
MVDTENRLRDTTVGEGGIVFQGREIHRINIGHSTQETPLDAEIWRQRYRAYADFLQYWEEIHVLLERHSYTSWVGKDNTHTHKIILNKYYDKRRHLATLAILGLESNAINRVLDHVSYILGTTRALCLLREPDGGPQPIYTKQVNDFFRDLDADLESLYVEIRTTLGT